MHAAGRDSHHLRGGPPVHRPEAIEGVVLRERRNWRIFSAFARQEYPECLQIIEEQLRACNGLAEYAIHVKGHIVRAQGQIQESLVLFQAATCLNPQNPSNLKEVGRCLFLLGKHKAALDVYGEAQQIDSEDWEVWHSRGLCYMHLKQFERALEAFEQANSISRHDSTFLHMGKVYRLQDKPAEALTVYEEALEFSPESPELLTTVGLLHLQQGENQKAFECLGNALTHDPRNPKAILAAGSIIQDNQDMDVALVKYRVSAVQACITCKYIAAVACLKRALYLDPFEWIVAYNLGLVHLSTSQYASAFHHFSAAINLKPDFAASYMYLAITLARLEDFDNACSAYDKALELDGGGGDYLTHLNYAVTLLKNDEPERAAEHYASFKKIFEALDPDMERDQEVLARSQALEDSLGASS
ncbi:unnamed protein product [Ectocarpus sp. 6 AP-2014]